MPLQISQRKGNVLDAKYSKYMTTNGEYDAMRVDGVTKKKSKKRKVKKRTRP
jgi:hypothetical protein